MSAHEPGPGVNHVLARPTSDALQVDPQDRTAPHGDALQHPVPDHCPMDVESQAVEPDQDEFGTALQRMMRGMRASQFVEKGPPLESTRRDPDPPRAIAPGTGVWKAPPPGQQHRRLEQYGPRDIQKVYLLISGRLGRRVNVPLHQLSPRVRESVIFELLGSAIGLEFAGQRPPSDGLEYIVGSTTAMEMMDDPGLYVLSRWVVPKP